MKLLYITNVDMSKINGATKHIRGFIKGMRSNNIEIVHIHPLMYSFNPKVKFLQLFYFNIISFLALLRHITKVDFIYLRLSPFIITPFIGKIFSKPILVELNGAIDIEAESIFSLNCIKLTILRIYVRLSFILTDRIITVSSNLKNYLIDRFTIRSNKIIPIQNSGEINCAAYIKREFTYKGLIAISDNPWFNIKELLALKDELSKSNICLDIFMGTHGGNEIEDSNLLLNKEIDFKQYDWGLLHNDDKFIKLREVVSPIKYFSYLSHAIPALVPKYSSVAELTSKNNTGWVYRKKEDLPGIIMSIYDDEEKWQLKCSDAYNLIKNKMNWKEQTKKILKRVNFER